MNVYFDMGTDCQGVQDLLAYDELAKPLPIWARLMSDVKAFLYSVYEQTDQCVLRLTTAISFSWMFTA